MVERTPFKTTIVDHWLSADWYDEPPRARTIACYGALLRYDWPHLVFAVIRGVDGHPYALHVFRRVNEACIAVWVFGAGPVCLGTRAARRIEAKALHPVDAFWQTDFAATADEWRTTFDNDKRRFGDPLTRSTVYTFDKMSVLFRETSRGLSF